MTGRLVCFDEKERDRTKFIFHYVCPYSVSWVISIAEIVFKK
jgi:hypothetical protein